MSTASTTPTRDGLAGRLAGRQQGRAGPPLRRVGGERADARVRRRRGRDGPGRARPRALDLPGAQGARRRGATRTARRRRPPARAARRRAAGLDRVHRRQPAGRRRADDVRRRLRATARVEPMAQRATQDPPGGGLAPRARARRGRGGSAAAAASATRSSRACSETWEQAGALARARTTTRATRAALDAGHGRAAAPPRSASRCAPGSSRCSPPRASRSR